ncbi:MAG: hypothetical protein ACTSSK_10065 [Candidatus Heimdallarchaeota archaeon]
MFKKSIKSLIEILLFGAVLSILLLSLSSGSIVGNTDSSFEPVIKPNAPILEIYTIYEISR